MPTFTHSHKSARSFNKVHIERVSKKQQKYLENKIYSPNSSFHQHVDSLCKDEIIITNHNSSHLKLIQQQKIPRNTFLTRKWSMACVSLLGLPVITALIIPNVLLYLMLPTIFKIPIINQTNITQTIVYGNHCGGVSSYKNWYGYLNNTKSIYQPVWTTNCSFTKTPLYYTNIIGKNLHTDFTGYNNIYVALANYFVIYIYSYDGYNVEQLLNYSQTEQWNISWVGVYQ